MTASTKHVQFSTRPIALDGFDPVSKIVLDDGAFPRSFPEKGYSVSHLPNLLEIA